MPGVCIYQRYLPPDLSGAGKQAVTLAGVLRNRGWDVLLLTDNNTDSERSGWIAGIPVVRVTPLPSDYSYPQLLTYWSRIGRALTALRHRYDVLHLHTAAFDQTGAIPVARALGKRVLVRSSLSGEFAELSRSRSGRMQRRVLGLADAAVVLSRRLAAEYRESGLPESQLQLIPNGVDTSIYHPVNRAEQASLRQELDLPEDTRIMVFHGVFLERKALHWLVNVLAPHLAALDLTLLFVGGPARDENVTGYAAQLRTTISRCPARDRIIIRGHDPAVYRYLQAADAYALPSTGEGLPNALLEAMAAGLVPFVSRTSGSEDVVTDGVNGFLFDPGDGAAFITALRQVFGDAAGNRAEDVGRAAAELIERSFSIRSTAEAYIRVYEGLVGASADIRAAS